MSGFEDNQIIDKPCVHQDFFSQHINDYSCNMKKKKTWGTLNYTCNPVRSLSELINQASCGSVFTVHFVNLISNVVFFFRINLAITLAVTTRGSEGELNARHFVSVWGSV